MLHCKFYNYNASIYLLFPLKKQNSFLSFRKTFELPFEKVSRCCAKCVRVDTDKGKNYEEFHLCLFVFLPKQLITNSNGLKIPKSNTNCFSMRSFSWNFRIVCKLSCACFTFGLSHTKQKWTHWWVRRSTKRKTRNFCAFAIVWFDRLIRRMQKCEKK